MSRHCACVPSMRCMREGSYQQQTMRVINTSQTLSLALIGCVDLGAVYSCKSNYSHWVEPQTVDFYTADLYLVLLSDHNGNFSKYNPKYLQTTALK